MVKHTQTNRRQIADDLFECVWPFFGIGAERVTRNDLYDSICMTLIRFLYDSTNLNVVNWKIVTTFCIKICMIRFLKDRMSSISSDLYEEILKPNKSHTNRIIQIVPCKTALTVLCKYSRNVCHGVHFNSFMMEVPII